MRIGIECQRLLRENKHGMEIVALELIKKLQQIDKKNEYFILVKDDKDQNCIQESENFKLKKIPSATFADWEQIHLPIAAKSLDLDVLHCTCNTGPCFQGSPTIITLHDIIYLESINFSGTAYQNLGNIYRRLIVPKIIPQCKSIITVSNFEKETILEKFKMDENLIKVVYNGVNPRFRVYTDEELASEESKVKLPEKYILFFGNTAPKKNTRGVLKAYALYTRLTKHPIPLVMTDYTEKNLIQELKLINEEEIFSQIRLPGYFPNKQIPLLYNKAEITLYPSLRESFGLPILESMACGTPVITSNISAMPEVAGDAAILIDPHNPEEIAEKIDLLLNDSTLYDSLKSKGLERVKQFSWESTAKSTIDVYNCVTS